MRKNLKKLLATSLSVVISLSCFVAPTFAATSQSALANEYAELKSTPAISTYTMAIGNKTMLDLTDSKALPTADDWWSNRIREASNVAYLNLDEASPEMRAVILTARYEIVSSKSWAADASYAKESDTNLFYDLFPSDWSVPRVNDDDYLYDSVSSEFVPKAYIAGVYSAPNYAGLEKEASNVLNKDASSLNAASPRAYGYLYDRAVYLTYSNTTLLSNYMTTGGGWILSAWGYAVSPSSFQAFVISVREERTGTIRTTNIMRDASTGESYDVYATPSFGPETISVFARTISFAGPMRVILWA